MTDANAPGKGGVQVGTFSAAEPREGLYKDGENTTEYKERMD